MTRLYDDHADVYDIAFDWEVGDEVAWMHARLGGGCRSVLEPGCGSGRILEAFARRGVEAVGVDRSPQMIELARKRLAEFPHAAVFLGDITGFSLGRPFEGAVCPVNTLLHLSPPEFARHLVAMADHLRPGARYLIQLALYDSDDQAALRPSQWETMRGDNALKISWVTEHLDPRDARLRQRSRIEFIHGPRTGEILEERHEMTAWTPERWRATVEHSRFEITATYDGGRDDRARVPDGSTGLMLWHELTRDALPTGVSPASTSRPRTTPTTANAKGLPPRPQRDRERSLPPVCHSSPTPTYGSCRVSQPGVMAETTLLGNREPCLGHGQEPLRAAVWIRPYATTRKLVCQPAGMSHDGATPAFPTRRRACGFRS